MVMFRLLLLVSLLVRHSTAVGNTSLASCESGSCDATSSLQVSKKTCSNAPCRQPTREEKETVFRALDNFYAEEFGYQVLSPDAINSIYDEFELEYEAEVERAKTAQGNAQPVRQRPESQGYVTTLYTLGAPGSGSPGLKSRRGSCFSGLRVYSTNKQSDRHDPVPWITNGDWLYHPKMASAIVNTVEGASDPLIACSDEAQEQPSWEYTPPWEFSLHSTVNTYVPAIEISSIGWLHSNANLTSALTEISYIQDDPGKAQSMAEEVGYNVVAAAKFEGTLTEGTQVAYLLQNDTLDCILTFQGTYSFQDIWTDASAFAVSFCGLTKEDETCCSLAPLPCLGTCSPKSGGSFVHMGFRNQLRRITGTSAFKDKVHARLPFCKDVMLFGHSLGGAMAELFSACAEQTWAEGDFGYEDFALMAWSKGNPKKLPIDAAF